MNNDFIYNMLSLNQGSFLFFKYQAYLRKKFF